MHIRLRHAILTLTMLAAASGSTVQAQRVTLPLADLNGSNGFIIDGESAGDGAGRSVSAAGDINGDGIDDVIIGADAADPNGSNSGRSYVVFGSGSGFTALLQLSSLDGSNGFRINGQAADDFSGRSVSAAGDINADGLDDLIIGATGANAGDTGRSYVVFGRSSGFAATLQLSSLDGSNGFAIDGELAGDGAGLAVSAAGDINADGIDDLVITAPFADPNGNRSGRSYIVFGRSTGFTSTFELSSLNGSNGFAMNGDQQNDDFGRSAKAAGDINDDSLDDLIIGANNAERGDRQKTGRSYVIFGRPSGFITPFPLSGLGGGNGLVIDGESAGDNSGFSVSAAGDINGDGVDDLIVGANNADPNGLSASGRSYVVFGRSNGLASPFALSTLDGSNGFALNGEGTNDLSGGSVSAAGDINRDGIDDLIIGALGADSNGSNSGRSYVIFGRRTGFASPLQLSSLDGTGFVIDGVGQNDISGTSVSAAGDVNDDGVDDLIIGAPNARRANGQSVGRAYVVFGVSELMFSDSFESATP